MRTTIIINAVTAGILACMPQAFAAEPWHQQVATGLGKQGSEMPGGVYRVGLPRTDLKVTLDGVEIKPGLALGSWLAFKPMGQDVMVMGDLVLTDEEVNPVMKRLGEGGIDITALHNHLLRGTPTTMYMHVHGHGDTTKLATTLREALGQSKTPFGGETAGISPEAATQAATTGSTGQAPGLDTAAIDQALGRKGKANGAVYQVNVPRRRRRRTTAWRCPRRWARPSSSTSRRPVRQGRDHRRLRAHRGRGEPGPSRLARERHRGHGAPQPHARRRAAALLHALLGKRRDAEGGEGPARGARPGQDGEVGRLKGLRGSSLAGRCAP